MAPNSNELSDSSDDSLRNLKWVDRLSVISFFAIAALILIDLILGSRKGAALSHLVAELVAALVAVGTGGLLLKQMVRTFSRDNLALSTRLQAVREESEQWRAEARRLIQGLSSAIEAQFGAWELSEAEKDVALLLLKGLSLKEIAAPRSTSEGTVRQQAGAVYGKAGVEGRSGLAAFFLEDLSIGDPKSDGAKPLRA